MWHFLVKHYKYFFDTGEYLKESSSRLVIVAKEFLKLPNLHMLIKKESITSQKLGFRDYW